MSFEVAHTIATNTASKSVAAFQASAEEDRRESNRFEKSITNVIRQNPNTQAEYDRTWVRWKVFYTNTLKQDIKTTPQGQHVRRFIAILPSKLRVSNPSYTLTKKTVEQLYLNLNALLKARYKDWSVTKHDTARWKSQLNLMLIRKEVSNTEGNRMSPFSLHCYQVKIIAEAILAKANFFGVRCWSVIIQQLFCLIFQAATGTRSGDFLRVWGINESFIKYRDLRLRLVGDNNTVEHLVLEVTLNSQKNEKFTNESRQEYLQPPRNDCPDKWHVNLITLILIHGIRNKAFEYNTLSEILQHTSNGYLKWKTEALDSPVIMQQDRWGNLVPNAPALSGTQNYIIKDSLTTISTTAHITSHSIRSGVASDNTNLPDNVLKAPSIAVGYTLNHSEAFVNKGKTFKHYVRTTGIDHFDARLDQTSKSLKHNFSPIPNIILEPYQKQKISSIEITQWIQNHPEWGKANTGTSEWLRQKASDMIHQEKLIAHEEQQLQNQKESQKKRQKKNQKESQKENQKEESSLYLLEDRDTDELGNQELARNLASILQVLELEESELILLEAQDAVARDAIANIRLFPTAHAFIESYATRIDRIYNYRESRLFKDTLQQPPDAFNAPCRFAVMYPQSEDTCKYSHWHSFTRGVHEKECKYNPKRSGIENQRDLE